MLYIYIGREKLFFIFQCIKKNVDVLAKLSSATLQELTWNFRDQF